MAWLRWDWIPEVLVSLPSRWPLAPSRPGQSDLKCLGLCKHVCVCVCKHARVYGAGVSKGAKKGVTGGRTSKKPAGRGLELSQPLFGKCLRHISASAVCWGFMGPQSPTMILVALNCVSPLMDAEEVLQPGGRLQPGPHLAPRPASVPQSDPGLPQGLGREEGWGGLRAPAPEQEPARPRSHRAGRGPRPGEPKGILKPLQPMSLFYR